MHPTAYEQLELADPGPRSPWARCICALGVVHAVICAVGLTLNLL